MALKLESLYYFMILAESESFTAAAEKLFMTQQALSKHIAGLEQVLGQSLIQRSLGQVGQKLTPAGEILRAESFPLLTRLSALDKTLETPVTQAEIWTLRIGATLILEGQIVDILNHWSEKDPGFRPEVVLPNGGPSMLESQLLAGALDFVVMLQPPLSPDLAWQALKPVPFIIAGAHDLDGPWQDLKYLAFLGNYHSLDEILNVWPEQRWPRQVVGKADAAMAVELAQHGFVCLHIPAHFVDLNLLKEVCPAPFEVAYTPYLVWSALKPLNQNLAAVKSDILKALCP